MAGKLTKGTPLSIHPGQCSCYTSPVCLHTEWRISACCVTVALKNGARWAEGHDHSQCIVWHIRCWLDNRTVANCGFWLEYCFQNTSRGRSRPEKAHFSGKWASEAVHIKLHYGVQFDFLDTNYIFQNGLENWRRESCFTRDNAPATPVHASLWLQWLLKNKRDCGKLNWLITLTLHILLIWHHLLSVPQHEISTRLGSSIRLMMVSLFSAASNFEDLFWGSGWELLYHMGMQALQH